MTHSVYETHHQMGTNHPLVIILLLGFIPFVGICLMMLGLYTTYLSIADGYPIEVSCVVFIIIMSVSVFFLVLGWNHAAEGLARYRFETNGLWVKYPFRSEIVIPWDEFQQVCVIHAEFTTRGKPRANSVICCVKKGEQTNLYGRWKTDNPFHYRSVICIAYTAELYAGIREKCPFDVPDLRETRPYQLREG